MILAPDTKLHTYLLTSRAVLAQSARTARSLDGVMEQLTRNYVITIIEVVSGRHFIALLLTLADHCR